MFPTYPLVIPMIFRCTYSILRNRRFRSISGTVTALQSQYLQSLPWLVHLWFFLLLMPRKRNKGIQSSLPLVAKVAKLQIRVKWLVVMMVAANEWWVRGECYGFELYFPLGTQISFLSLIPVSFVLPTTLIGYRWACLRTKYTDYPLNCLWLSYPFWRSYSHALSRWYFGVLDLILFDTRVGSPTTTLRLLKF